VSTDEFAVHGVVRLHDRADMVSAVPFLLGFAPDDCLVVLSLADGRLEVTARLDLPTPPEAPAAAAELTRALSHTNLTGAVVVGYGPAADVDPALTAFTAWLHWPVRDVLRVTDDRWRSLTCATPDCCPPGAPVITSPEVTAALIATSGSRRRHRPPSPPPPAVLINTGPRAGDQAERSAAARRLWVATDGGASMACGPSGNRSPMSALMAASHCSASTDSPRGSGPGSLTALTQARRPGLFRTAGEFPRGFDGPRHDAGRSPEARSPSRH
jgi:hypothetical protein